MTIPHRIGMSLVSYDGSIDGMLEDAVRAEELGYDDVWFGDTGAPDALTTAAVVAERTRSVRIGTAVTPVYTRTPAVLAATVATLQQLSHGRFLMGLGTSSERMIENWHGLPFTRPLSQVRETTALLRQILSGEKSDFQGDCLHSAGYRQPAVQTPVPIYLAALRPRMLALAAGIADGVILNLFPRPALSRIRAILSEGASGAGRELSELEVVCRFQVAVTEDTQGVIEGLRYFLAPYFSQSVYNRFLAWCGYPEVAAEIAEGWKQKDRQRTMAALSDELLHDIAVVGDLDYCQQRLRDYAAAGIHTMVLSCPSLDPGTRQRTFEAFARENFSFQSSTAHDPSLGKDELKRHPI